MIIMIPVKRTIALAVAGVFVINSVYGFLTGKVDYNTVLPVITMVIGYYFGKGGVDDGN